jgi:hypothetical protein
MDFKIKLLSEQKIEKVVFSFFFLILFILFISTINAATPQGPDTLNSVNNSTKGNTSAKEFNISGGYIATFNLSATLQNPRWKGFVGNVTGSFTLDDATGATIYDWTLSTIAGRVFATRTSGSVTWGSLVCATNATLEAENLALAHSNNDDNITKTFQRRAHPAFTAAGQAISANDCPTARPYVSDNSQQTKFNETALHDGTNHVFCAELENNQAGYDGNLFDFQMIVPENGSAGYGGSTAYYMYVELE